MFYGRSSEYLWEMDNGDMHRILQGEGGEQGDPMMPLLYSLGQHGTLEAVNDRFSTTRGVWCALLCYPLHQPLMR